MSARPHSHPPLSRSHSVPLSPSLSHTPSQFRAYPRFGRFNRERVGERERERAGRCGKQAAAIALLILAFALSGAPAPAQNPDLPFSTDETTGPLTLAIRHSVEFDRKARKLSWDRLEIDLSAETRLRAAPGSFDFSTSATNNLSLELDVHRGSIRAEPTVRGDYSWETPIAVRLAPRDLHWSDPPIDALGIELDGNFALDSSLAESPAMLARAEIARFGLASAAAGPYKAVNIAARGAWARPAWRIDEFSAETFSGKISISGEGAWSAQEPARVALDVTAEGLDLQELLKAFEIPQGEQIKAKVSGAVKIDAIGREWRRLDFDLRGEAGTVFIERQFLLGLLEQLSGGSLKREQIEQVLTGAFGDAPSIPFGETGLSGSYSGDTLRLKLPLVNEALNLTFEPNVEGAVMWDLYDQLIDTGLKNVGLLDVEAESVPKAEPDDAKLGEGAQAQAGNPAADERR